jgi:hypothetical protein
MPGVGVRTGFRDGSPGAPRPNSQTPGWVIMGIVLGSSQPTGTSCLGASGPLPLVSRPGGIRPPGNKFQSERPPAADSERLIITTRSGERHQILTPLSTHSSRDRHLEEDYARPDTRQIATKTKSSYPNYQNGICRYPPSARSLFIRRSLRQTVRFDVENPLLARRMVSPTPLPLLTVPLPAIPVAVTSTAGGKRLGRTQWPTPLPARPPGNPWGGSVCDAALRWPLPWSTPVSPAKCQSPGENLHTIGPQ